MAIFQLLLGYSPLLAVAGSFAATVAAIWGVRSVRRTRIDLANRAEGEKQSNQQFQKELSEINRRGEIILQQVKERASKKTEGLIEIAQIAGETCYYLERYLTPYTRYKASEREEFLSMSEAHFERLMNAWWRHAVFVFPKPKIGEAIGIIMGQINTIRGLSYQGKGKDKYSQAIHFEQIDAFRAKVGPAFERIRKEVDEELGHGAVQPIAAVNT
jgi:hypothetical protein